MNELSGGERQRVVLARALATDARVLLLDEPTANLDLAHQAMMFRLVRERCRDDNASAIVITHDLNLAAEFADEVILLKNGQVFASGTPKEQRLNALMDLLQGFIIGANEVVRQETQDWMAEFKGHLAVLEQRVEAQRTALATAPSMVYGAIKLLVEGSEKLKEGSRWKVVLGTGRELSGAGPQAVVATSLGPGLLGLRFEAVLKDGRQFVTEDVTTIKASEVTTHVFMVP
jgi:ABC-type glutathione transport system ATPase component